MAIILNINTAFDNASVGVSINGKVISELQSDSPKDHASFLQPAIKKLCAYNSIALKDIDAISVINGPGSYTGLRVGLSSAKALCYVLQKPLILLNSLDVMANALKIQSHTINPDVLFCPLIDARRMEVYTGLYNNELELIKNYSAEIVNEHFLKAERSTKPVIAGGNGSLKLQNIIPEDNITYKNPLQLSLPAAILSAKAYANKNFASLAYSEPFYLKDVYFIKS